MPGEPRKLQYGSFTQRLHKSMWIIYALHCIVLQIAYRVKAWQPSIQPITMEYNLQMAESEEARVLFWL